MGHVHRTECQRDLAPACVHRDLGGAVVGLTHHQFSDALAIRITVLTISRVWSANLPEASWVSTVCRSSIGMGPIAIRTVPSALPMTITGIPSVSSWSSPQPSHWGMFGSFHLVGDRLHGLDRLVGVIARGLPVAHGHRHPGSVGLREAEVGVVI